MRIQTVLVDRDGSPVRINQKDCRPGERLWGVVESAKGEPKNQPDDGTDIHSELIEKLAAHGIKRDRRASVATLQRLLDEAEAK